MAIDQGTIKKRVDEVKVDDMVDLQDDPYVKHSGSHPEMQFAFANVEEIEQDGPGCIVLHTSQGSFGFPPDHLIEWKEKTF